MKNLLNHQAYYLANHFADSKLTKNRIQMMIHPQTKPYKKLYFLWAIPICSLILLFNVSYIYAQDKAKEPLFIVGKDKKYGLLNVKKELVVPYIYDDIKTGTNKEDDLIAVMLEDKWGFIDRKGKEIIKPQFENIINYQFVNDIAIVHKNEKYAFINKTGKLLTSFKYDWIEGFNKEGLSVAQFENRFGIINNNNEVIIPFEYLFVDLPNEKGWCLAQNDDYQWGFVNLENEVIIPFKYEGLDKVDAQGWIKTVRMVGENYIFGFIDEKQHTKIPFEYEQVTNFQEDGLAYAQKNGKWGVINRQNEVIVPFEYEPPKHDIYDKILLKNIQHDRIVMQKGEKYGLLDYQNNIVIPFEYLQLKQIKQTKLLSAYNEKGKGGCLDLQGNVIVPFKYNGVIIYEHCIIGHSVEGKTEKEFRFNHTLYNLEGEIIIPDSKDYMFYPVPNNNNQIIVRTQDFKKGGLIDKYGNFVMPLEDRFIRPLN